MVKWRFEDGGSWEKKFKTLVGAFLLSLALRLVGRGYTEWKVIYSVEDE